MAELPMLDDRWVIAQRGPRNTLDPWRPYACLVEPERTATGVVEDCAVIFLTNRECPWRCVMCDLWKNTTTEPVPVGAITAQVEYGLSSLPPVRHVKLYNAGSFFDRRAIPIADRAAVARRVAAMETVIIECHPALVGPECIEFAAMLDGRLEVAMGLETVDPAVLPRLNKGMTLDDFSRAARFLVDQKIGLRSFILLRAPFQSENEGVYWAKRSLDFAFDAGAQCCVVIPTRGGNGAMEGLAERGDFAPPTLDSLEEVIEYGIGLHRGRVFADLWDMERLMASRTDAAERVQRLRQMNLLQQNVNT